MKFAVPVAQNRLTLHFGHAKEFAIIDTRNNKIVRQRRLTPPPHAPGVLPMWMNDLGVSVIIAGGMGKSAMKFFEEYGIKVVTGAPTIEPEKLVQLYLSNTLLTMSNACDQGCGGHQ